MLYIILTEALRSFEIYADNTQKQRTHLISLPVHDIYYSNSVFSPLDFSTQKQHIAVLICLDTQEEWNCGSRPYFLCYRLKLMIIVDSFTHIKSPRGKLIKGKLLTKGFKILCIKARWLNNNNQEVLVLRGGKKPPLFQKALPTPPHSILAKCKKWIWHHHT